MKDSYFGFGSPQQQADMHSRSKNTFIHMHLFLPYLLNDSQAVNLMIHFSNPLLCVTLLWLVDCSHVHLISPVMPDKAVFVSVLTSAWSGLGFVLKTTRFNDSESTISTRETITLYTVHFQIEHFAGCFHSLRAVLHTAWKIIFNNTS